MPWITGSSGRPRADLNQSKQDCRLLIWIAVVNSMLKEAEKGLTNLSQKPNNIFTLTKSIKKDGKDFKEEICIRG